MPKYQTPSQPGNVAPAFRFSPSHVLFIFPLICFAFIVGYRAHSGPAKVIKLKQFYERKNQLACFQSSRSLGFFNKPNCTVIHQGPTGAGVLVQYNSFGFRDREYSGKKKGRIRVLVAGDTRLVPDGTDIQKTIPKLLESELANRKVDAEVINVTSPGHSLFQQYLTLEKAIAQYHPNLVVLLGTVSGYLNSKTIAQHPYIKFSQTGNPTEVRIDLINPLPRLLADLTRGGADETLFFRELTESWSNFMLSWKCATTSSLGIQGKAHCMLEKFTQTVKRISDLSEKTGVRFLYAAPERVFENETLSLIRSTPPLIKLITLSTPRIEISSSEWMSVWEDLKVSLFPIRDDLPSATNTREKFHASEEFGKAAARELAMHMLSLRLFF